MKEKTLSEKRKNIIIILEKMKIIPADIFIIMKVIEGQDKEFIKKLNKEIEKGQCPDCSEKVPKCKCNYKNLFATINRNFVDKLAGEELAGVSDE